MTLLHEGQLRRYDEIPPAAMWEAIAHERAAAIQNLKSTHEAERRKFEEELRDERAGRTMDRMMFLFALLCAVTCACGFAYENWKLRQQIPHMEVYEVRK